MSGAASKPEINQTQSNGRGGRRAGAGRKAGAVTKRTREVADKAAAAGLTPLDYMLALLRDEAEEKALRFEAAKSAAPYVHARLSSIDANVEGKVGVTVEIVRLAE